MPMIRLPPMERMLISATHFRRLPIDLTPLTASLLRECSAQSCPEMKAGEWQYICVANHQGKTEDEGRMDGQGKADEEPKGQGVSALLSDRPVAGMSLTE